MFVRAGSFSRRRRVFIKYCSGTCIDDDNDNNNNNDNIVAV